MNRGSPHRSKISTRRRKPTMRTIDILGTVLWYYKSIVRQYTLCMLFGRRKVESRFGSTMDYK